MTITTENLTSTDRLDAFYKLTHAMQHIAQTNQTHFRDVATILEPLARELAKPFRQAGIFKAEEKELRFFWNGIKVGKGKLQRAFFSDGKLLNYPEGTITIYGRDYVSFSAEIRKVFTVQNDTEIQTDYFEQDRIRVTPSHPLYQQVKAALDARNARYA